MNTKIDLKQFEIFSELPIEIIENLLREHKILKLKRGDFLYHVGDQANSLFLIQKGLLGLVVNTEKGGEHLLRLFRTGQFLGHRSLFAKEPYHASSMALEDSEVIQIPAFCIERLMMKYPQMAILFLKKLSSELKLAEQQRIAITERDVMCRVAEAILYIKQIDPDHAWTRKEIADFVGSTGPTVTKILIKMNKKGLIRLKGRQIEIAQRSLLEKLCSGT
jgi:CRP-like cAMP-binding protein